MKKPKIAHLISEYLISNQTYIYDQLLDHEDKYEIIVISRSLFPGRKNFPFKRVYALVPWSRVYSKLVSINEGVVDKLSEKYFEFQLRKEKIDLLHAHFGTFGTKLVNLKERLGIPLLVSFYGDDASAAPKRKEWEEGYKRLFEKADSFIAICEDMKQELISHGCPEEKIHIVHVATDLNTYSYKERNIPEDGTTINFLKIAKFEGKKGIKYLLEAFNRLSNKMDNVKLTLVGYGPDLDKIKYQIDNLNLEDNVELIDTTEITKTDEIFPLIKKLLQKKDIFVHPSLTTENNDKEGTPTIIMAASSCGMPVISTKHAGIPEVVVDGETGYLVPEKDVDALYKKMKYLAENPMLWNKMGKAGRKHIEKEFSRKSLTKNLQKVYKTYL